jgi:hypothetical protein
MKDQYPGLDPALQEHAEKYRKAQEKFTEAVGSPANYVYFRASAKPPASWDRTVERLNAKVPA